VTKPSAAWAIALARLAPLALGLAFATPASAQMGGMGGGGRAPQSQPTQSSPVRNTQVGPRAGGSASEEEEEPGAQPFQRTEPQIAPPADPLAVPPTVRESIGTDYAGPPPSPVGDLEHTSYAPYYEERRGEYRFRMLPPLWLEQTRGLPPRSGAPVAGEPTQEDRQSLFGLLYYQRRSPRFDVDTFFPAFWHVRDEDSNLLVLGPFAHREATFEHDNWLAPLYFEGARKDGGYLHMPLLLTTSRWSEKSSFTYSLLYFRDRKEKDVDWGVAPFVFHGDNGNVDGARKSYTLVPPLLYYHREREIDSNAVTIAGPVLLESTPKTDVVDVLPLFFHSHGNPDTGGVKESHTTLFPFFHYGESPDRRLLVVPGYVRRVTKTADTMLTPFYSFAETRSGATSLTVAGPIIPFYLRYTDRDIGLSTTMVAPFFVSSSSPESSMVLTPLVGRFETRGISQTWWFAPTLTVNTNTHGWETDLHPLIYLGRTDDASHTVIAPLFWDFASNTSRTTIAAPLFWRFHDAKVGSITQIAANTVYLERRVEGGRDWQFHLVPLFSYGEDPQGYFWNVLFGLAGYQREGSFSRVRALWVPITVSGSAAAVAEAGGNTSVRF
jgi:hypothetical protein